MKKKGIYTILLALCLVVFLTACQDKGEEQGSKDNVLPPAAPVDVEFSVDPATGIKPNQPVQLQVLLTQAGEIVEDADQVRFEIWHEDDQEEDHDAGSDAGHDSDADHDADTDHEGDAHDHSSMEHHNTDNEMVTAEHIGGGVYAYEYQFEKSGVYYVMYHVDARDLHMMTANEVIVE